MVVGTKLGEKYYNCSLVGIMHVTGRSQLKSSSVIRASQRSGH